MGIAMMMVLAGCATAPGPRSGAGLTRYEFTRPQMGVPFRLVLYAPDEPSATRAADAAFERVARLNAILSDYDPDSEINRLCHQTPVGQPAPVSPELGFMLARSQDLARATDGAFDVTVGPVVNLWRRARRRVELPPPELLAQARARSGWQHLRFDARHRTVTFLVADMRLDFGAIAKGYAADEALRILREHGLPRALVGAAGDVTAWDPPPGEPGWRIEIGGLDLTNAPPPRLLRLRRGAVSTSGDLFQRLEIDGRRYSHIVDPRTGIGLTDHSLVTVIARDGTTADGLDTAASVLGPEAGLRLIEATPGAAALILRAPTGTIEVLESRRLPALLRRSR
jgi:thiamine biosynthesis lipoprotein